MKVYIVYAEVDLAVAANSPQEAEQIARRVINQEAPESFDFHPRELMNINLIEDELAEAYPWNGDGTKTVRQIFMETLRQEQEKSNDGLPFDRKPL